MGPELAVFFILSVGIFLPVSHQETVWKAEEFPDPALDPVSCGREGNTSSYVCDPDNWLTQQEGYMVDQSIEELFNATQCSCNQTDGNCTGYSVGVAVVSWIVSNTSEDELDATKEFADYLRDVAWNYGYCGDDIYIVINVGGRRAWTSVGEAVAESLATDCIQIIFDEASVHYSAFDFSAGVLYTIQQYQLVLTAGHDCTKAVAGSILGLVLGLVLGLLALCILIGLPLYLFVCRRSCSSKNKVDSNDNEKVSTTRRRSAWEKPTRNKINPVRASSSDVVLTLKP